MDDTKEILHKIMRELERIFPDHSIVMMVAPFSETKGARLNYISNTERKDIIVILREILARFEGHTPSVPETTQ